MTPEYVYDPAWQQEFERLEALERLFDPASRHFMERLGIAPGWRCLEVGAGAGGLARWLADQVGPGGHVVATDLNPRYLAALQRDNVEVRRYDLAKDPLIGNGSLFDLVHARAVLEHLAAPRQALERLVAATRPGGWLVVEDIDFGGPQMGATLERYVSPVERGSHYRRIVEAMRVLFSRRGISASFGASLATALADAGLCEVGAELHAPFVAGGQVRDCMRLTVDYLRAALVDGGLVDGADIANFIDLTHDETVRYVPLFMITAWGRRGA